MTGGDSHEDQYRRAWEQEIEAGKAKQKPDPAEEASDRKLAREIKRDEQDKS